MYNVSEFERARFAGLRTRSLAALDLAAVLEGSQVEGGGWRLVVTAVTAHGKVCLGVEVGASRFLLGRAVVRTLGADGGGNHGGEGNGEARLEVHYASWYSNLVSVCAWVGGMKTDSTAAMPRSEERQSRFHNRMGHYQSLCRLWQRILQRSGKRLGVPSHEQHQQQENYQCLGSHGSHGSQSTPARRNMTDEYAAMKELLRSPMQFTKLDSTR